MKIVFKDCDDTICKELDKWLFNIEIKRHAMSDQSFSDEFAYYKDNRNIINENVHQKVVYIDNILMAYIVLMQYEENRKKEISINPIVVNPLYHNQGNGKKIMQYLINNIEKIINDKVVSFVAAISINNIISIKLFKSLGFSETGYSNDESYVYLILKSGKKS